MNKPEIGMYVKFKTLSNQIKIGKIKEIDGSIYDLDNDVTADKYVIGKPSFNIIDLIEVGDVITTINLCGEVTKIDKENNKIYTTCYDGEYCHKEDIKTVVTKEQFESMSYRIGE